VHDEGWTDEAVASGTLDAGLPPSYIGRAMTSSTSPSFGSADLVEFFMEECNSELRRRLAASQADDEGKEERPPREVVGERGENSKYDDGVVISSRMNEALRMRLSMVLPFVASDRWHEGMAIGALPQNVHVTARQLDDIANIALNYALGRDVDGGNDNHHPAHRAAIMAAYASAEMHLLADGKDGATIHSGGGMNNNSSLSLSGERYRATWTFLEARSAEVARLIVNGANGMPSLNMSFPDPTRVMAASAVASSLAGAALSLAAPSAAAVAGHVLPRAMSSVLAPIQGLFVAGGRLGGTTDERDGTRPSDYAAVGTQGALPPFDASEEIFSGSGGKASS